MKLYQAQKESGTKFYVVAESIKKIADEYPTLILVDLVSERAQILPEPPVLTKDKKRRLYTC